MSIPEEDTEYDVELGPLFALGVIALVYGLLRRRPLPAAVGIGGIWLDQRSEFGRNLRKRADAALKAQIKAHARRDSSGSLPSDRAGLA